MNKWKATYEPGYQQACLSEEGGALISKAFGEGEYHRFVRIAKFHNKQISPAEAHSAPIEPAQLEQTVQTYAEALQT